ncbi:uncharacterized protein BT62DRAFT_1046363 [Guyanagaster necrorhizus]|uniref:Uncharacterized protein n=1 Tax=Guyanagaster necrorhizus TaxID=856835 RepID=A0A9P8AN17_9AGAR|nr:uncharacterized protein BT62DRAFT_1046363 [Guyanagaster necrorhizus MCA 3950]KAG7441291.1 hypothetical protein BT62DRAFT_1046363 [Guyanagaster necrorhizus MCA 3950]
MQKQVSTNPGEKVAALAFCLLFNKLPAYDGNQLHEDAWNGPTNTMNVWQQSGLFFLYPELGSTSKKWRPSWDQVMTWPLPADRGDQHGELIVKDAYGSTHMFTIIATHQYPIPEDMYALLGSYSKLLKSNSAMQYWVVG